MTVLEVIKIGRLRLFFKGTSIPSTSKTNRKSEPVGSHEFSGLLDGKIDI